MILGLRTEIDSVLAAVAPLGLAAAAPKPALVVDLDPLASPYPGERSLADLIHEGPSRRDLHPDRNGVALLSNGGVQLADAATVLTLLSTGWPSVVLRLGRPDGATPAPWPVVPVVPLFPGFLKVSNGRPAVWQTTTGQIDPPGPGPVLPRLPRLTMMALLDLQLEARSRWVRAWAAVWDLPWE